MASDTFARISVLEPRATDSSRTIDLNCLFGAQVSFTKSGNRSVEKRERDANCDDVQIDQIDVNAADSERATTAQMVKVLLVILCLFLPFLAVLIKDGPCSRCSGPFCFSSVGTSRA